MLNGFETITMELAPFEINKIVPILQRVLLKQSNKTNPISNKRMVEGLKKHFNINTNSVRIRKMIHFMRVSGTVSNLLSNSKGYYISEDKEEIKNCIRSLQQREKSISQGRVALEKQLYKMMETT